MLTRVVVVPYKMGSKSAKALKESLVAAGIRCFRKKADSGYVPRPRDLIIYYGGTDHVYWPHPYTAINKQREQAQNKLTAFQAFKEANLSTVEWTTNPNVAQEWETVVVRKILTGHSGQGIAIWQNGLVPLNYRAPLYTKYQKKTYECRVHVFNGKVIDAQIKRKRTTEETEEANTYVRNVHSGWVYCREDFVLPVPAADLAIAAVQAVGLDFGAVDLIYNKYHNQFYLLEVNTAPGLEGTTLINYTKEILNVCKTN